MNCPTCSTEIEMAYSNLSHSFICMDADCGFELEIEPQEALALLEIEAELMYA